MSASAASIAEAPAAAGPSPQVRAWVAEFAKGWRAPAGPEAFAEHFERVIDPQMRFVQPQIPTFVGHEAFRERFVRPLFALIPDLHGEVERWAGGEDAAYIELTLRGTLGGRPISWTVVDRVTIRDGLAVERVSYFDPVPLLLAVLTRPRAWPRFVRLRAPELRAWARARTGR